MKLSMWILHEWLKKYNPESSIKDSRLNISSVRLFSPDITMDSSILYIGCAEDFSQPKNFGTLCIHGNDTIHLKTVRKEEVLNALLQAFDFYSQWNDHMLEMIYSGQSASDLLAYTEKLFPYPVFLLDSNQSLLAMSLNTDYKTKNTQWENLREFGHSDINLILDFNANHSYVFQYTGLYHLKYTNFADHPAYFYNFFINENLVGLAGLVDDEDKFSRGILDVFILLCQYFDLWFQTHAQEQNTLLLESVLHQAFTEQPFDSDSLQIQFERMGWPSGCQKLLIVLENISEQFNLNNQFCRIINHSVPDCYAILHNQNVCILCGCSSRTDLPISWKLRNYIKSGNYYGCYSDTFTDFKNLHDYFWQAFVTTEFCQKKPGHLASYREFTLTYAFSIIHRYMDIRFVHPEVLLLLEYDRAHHTEFSKTLHAYLRYERSPVRTAEYLNIHRHSLGYRLKRIYELCNFDLNNEKDRLHILNSYAYLSDFESSRLLQ
ncbi:carbohydrate diacid transcriptional activator CdaR [uncultured Roseburia sp.]|uniref:Helix-turn-helix domain-containing protein n=1 Tax=Brotonthovivens ammoniilytica TaxID=2981725 RepID=A0ABT2TG80_9FIRM|nr:helix-turn-helix domain-containing protein [Brotonthovivens ammoniilytica]MCU6761182.1 helix-turn-helix domain-containing protein [Brotonthovivens ammoniilytica]SCI21268.1 carbohydrate diacid transcriptional activator CdaR [uncultured Roseburia sp.]